MMEHGHILEGCLPSYYSEDEEKEGKGSEGDDFLDYRYTSYVLVPSERGLHVTGDLERRKTGWKLFTNL